MASRSSKQRKKLRHIRRRTAPGTAPGTVVVDPAATKTTVHVIAYSESELQEFDLSHLDSLPALLEKWPSIWIDVTGLGSLETIQTLGRMLNLHPLAMEDVVNVHQRAKVDPFTDNIFIVARMVDGNEAHQTEQISIFLRRGVLLSFQERPGDCWEPIRQRLRSGRGRVRAAGTDYLCYSLLDSIIDSYFPIVDQISDKIDHLDEEITLDLREEQMHRIHELRGQLLGLRRAIRPHREMINELARDEHPLFCMETRVFLRDCYDHVIQVIDLVDTYRELTADLRDFYVSSVSNRMNEIMKVLTIIATIFIPLSFVAGVYGMNFDTEISPLNMPELKWYFGYPFAWAIMLSMAGGLLWHFRRRKWI